MARRGSLRELPSLDMRHGSSPLSNAPSAAATPDADGKPARRSSMLLKKFTSDASNADSPRDEDEKRQLPAGGARAGSLQKQLDEGRLQKVCDDAWVLSVGACPRVCVSVGLSCRDRTCVASSV